MDFIPVVSTQLDAIAYDRSTRHMQIRFFPKKGTDISPLYEYSNVDLATWIALNEAESKGSYFFTHIRNNPDKFPYKRLR